MIRRLARPGAPRGGVSSSCAPAIVVVLLLTMLPGDALAQEGCVLGDLGNDVADVRTLPGIGQVTYISRPHLVCEGGIQIFADTAVAYAERGLSHLMGSVRYISQGRELLADTARYFSNAGRLQANGHVSVVDEEQGSSLRNGDLVYLRRTSFRDVEEMTLTIGADGVRPEAVLRPPPPTDSLAPSADAAPTDEDPPYTVVADRIFLLGSGSFTATGTVEIVRDSLFAYADSAQYEQTSGDMALEGSARVEGDAYELTGRRITMSAPDSVGREVHAVREARLEGDGLLLTAAQIRVFLAGDALDRLVATPLVRPGSSEPDSVDSERPEAEVDAFVLTADSLEVNAPGERIERVFAAGTARSVSTSGDSLNVERLPEIARTDWLEGDTVIVTFAPAVSADADQTLADETLADVTVLDTGESDAPKMEVDEIVARVRARSLYRLPPNDSTAHPGTDPPAVHYVVGDEIRILMAEGQVDALHVKGQTRGMHLEPFRRPAPPDTGAADTTVVDTTSVATQPSRSRQDDGGEPEPGPAIAKEVPWIRP